MTDLCLECSTLTLFIMGGGLKKICQVCSEASSYHNSLREEKH